MYVDAVPGHGADGRARPAARTCGARSRTWTCRPAPSTATRGEDFLNQFLNIFVALLLLSELIAVLGIVNTLMLSVHERTRELGLLRTVGTSRRQVWGMVSGESVIIAVLGCVVGIGVGLMWGWGVMAVVGDRFSDGFVVPVGDLLWFVVASVVAGFVAALFPAWHASRLDVLEAIAQE